MNADNQQERLGNYIAGYTDGEGSFHIAIQKVPHVKFGQELIAESDMLHFLKCDMKASFTVNIT